MNITWLRISSDTAPDMIYSNVIQQVQNGMILNLLKHLIVMYLLIVIAMSQFLIQANELYNSHFRVFIFVLPVSDIGNLVFILKF